MQNHNSSENNNGIDGLVVKREKIDFIKLDNMLNLLFMTFIFYSSISYNKNGILLIDDFVKDITP